MTLSPLSAAILATLLMYLLTALGAALVFPLRRFHPSVMNLLMALGAGIMLAASYFSLLAPALTSAHFARRAACAVGGCAAFTPDAPNAAVRRAPQNRSADWQHHPAQHSRRLGGRLRVRCFGVPRRGGVAQRVDACHRHCAAKLPRRGGGQSAAPPRRLFLPPFVLLRTVIRRSRAACWDSGRTAGDSRPRRPAAAAFALRRRHGDGHLGGASAGMPKMPAAASDGSRDAGGLCPHDGTGYNGDWVITH